MSDLFVARASSDPGDGAARHRGGGPTGRVGAAGDRIARIQRRYQSGEVWLSVQRARHYTESWRRTEGSGLSTEVRVAMAMLRVYDRVDVHVDLDDRIAGAWTEHFQGMPVDIERGVFNRVLSSELSHRDLWQARGRSLVDGVRFVAAHGGPVAFLRSRRQSRRAGRMPLDLRPHTMDERQINAFQISDADRQELRGHLLPWWRGRTAVDRLEAALARSGLRTAQMAAFTRAVGGQASRQVSLLTGSASIATFQGHLVADFEPVLRRGLTALREETAAWRAAAEQDADVDAGERDFLHARALALEGMERFARRTEAAVARVRDLARDPQERAALTDMLERCRRVPFEPARSFAEALQAFWTLKTALELAHPVNLHCPGRLDQLLLPWYEADLRAGRTTPQEATELLAELLLKNMAQNIRPESNFLGHFYHRYLGSSPITIGGVRRDGQDATNALTWLFVEAAARSRAVCNIAVRVAPLTPDALLARVAEVMRQGTSVFSLSNDQTHIAAMLGHGFALEDARDHAVMGCVEATSPGRTGAMSAGALQLCRLLDTTLRDGDCRVMAGTLQGDGPRTGQAGQFQTFEALLGAFESQAQAALRTIEAASNLRDAIYAAHLPAPLISTFTQGCAERRRDVTRGGAPYDLSGVSLVCSVANLVDSLHVIRTLVFEQRRVTLPDLVRAMDDNFEGHGALLRQIAGVEGRWGNGEPRVDALANEVVGRLCAAVKALKPARGGAFVPYVISMTAHTIDGRLSMATPDGRRAATPFAASCNPFNVERAGMTATLRSVAALPFETIMGAAVNIKLHPSALGSSEAGRGRWVALLRAYFDLGGAQLQPTVVSAAMLREARDQPEAHRGLIVKVGGYSTYFTDLGREIQDEVIARTEHA